MQGNNTEYHGRQRLRPWLISKIDSHKCPGLDWVDRTQCMFRVPWKHGGKQDWSAENSLIFKEWAIHTGRFRQGIDKEDWPVWKTRFRCAMNKLPDIEEAKERSQLDGDEPYRVYKFLPNPKIRNNIQYDNKAIHIPNNHVRTEPIYQQVCDGPLNLSSSNKFGTCIPETVRDINFGSTEQHEGEKKECNLTSDLGIIDMKDLVGMRQRRDSVMLQRHDNQQTSSSCIKDEEDMDTIDGCLITDNNQYPTDATTGAPITLRILAPYVSPMLHIPQNREPQDYEMIVRLQFRQQVVAQHHITNPDGLRLYYGQPAAFLSEDQNLAYGSTKAQEIEFPLSELRDNADQRRYTQQLLGHLDRGLILETRNGDIYATRRCRVVVFVAALEDNTPIKINRNCERTKIFDYEAFRNDLHNYANGQGPKPSAKILLGFGQNWKNSLEPYSNILISATIFHPKAIYELSKITGNGLLSPPVQISDSDEMDRYIEIYKHITSKLL